MNTSQPRALLTTITNGRRIELAQRDFENRVRAAAKKSGPIKLGYQGGGSEEGVYFFGSLDFWVSLADSDNRYWNALGLGIPFKGDKTIIAEINPPKSGLNHRVSGLFASEAGGRIYLAHRGRVGGGRLGIGQKAFLAWYPDPISIVNDGDKATRVIVIGALDGTNRETAEGRLRLQMENDLDQPRRRAGLIKVRPISRADLT